MDAPAFTPPYRKRLRRRESEQRPDCRFLTFSCFRRCPLFGAVSSDPVQTIFAAALDAARRRHGYSLYAWVVMPEHVHLLARPRAGQVWATLASSIKNITAKRGLAHLRATGAPILEAIRTRDGAERFWQTGGGFDRTCRDEAEFCHAVRYIHRNPVERGLVTRPEDWHSSSMRWWMGERSREIECDAPPLKGLERWKGYR